MTNWIKWLVYQPLQNKMTIMWELGSLYLISIVPTDKLSYVLPWSDLFVQFVQVWSIQVHFNEITSCMLEPDEKV